MLFNSYLFVFAFLPLALAGYFGFNHIKKTALAEYFLIAMSLWFYAYFNISYLPIIIGSILVNYGCACLFRRLQSQGVKRAVFALGLAANLGTLGYYKYMGFFTSVVNDVFKTDFFELTILLPLGISFFTFQQVSYLVDSYKDKVPVYRFREYALFVTFFPQLIAGPIVLHSETVPQFADHAKKQFQWDNFAVGLMAFSCGMAKKVIIADYFGSVVTWGFANADDLGSIRAIFLMLCYTFQLYFDFSGYCDMATGIGKMFNIDIPMNFNSPHKSRSITEFWQRWHITLGRFLRGYVYFPLGGSRKGKVRTYVNLFVVFLASGLWHGANYTFILWGVLQGIAMVVEKICHEKGFRGNAILGWVYMFAFVNVTNFIFRADSVSQAMMILRQMISCSGNDFLWQALQTALQSGVVSFATTLGSLATAEISTFALYALGVILIAVLTMRNTNEKIDAFRPNVLSLACSAWLLYFSIISFSGVSVFMYFNF